MRSGSVSSAPVVGLRAVKRVCGALSGLELTRVSLWKEGRVMVKVSVIGLKRRVVDWEKSVGSLLVGMLLLSRTGFLGLTS